MAVPQQIRQLQALARLELEQRECAKTPWYAISKGYILTEDEKRGGITRVMPPLPYLHILCDLFMKYPIGVMLKSRQMMASWLFCWIILWTAKYHKGSLSLMQGKRLDDVKAIGTKSLMGRLLFMYRNLPDFLKSKDELDAIMMSRHQKKHDPTAKGGETLTTLVIPGGGVAIAAPQGPDVIRSKTATTVVMDELPHHPEGLEAWTAALPTVDGADPKYSKSRLWGVGTPNGMDPLCYNMAKWENWRTWKEMTGFKYKDGTEVEGLRVYLKEREYEGYKLSPICCVRLHYTAEYDPDAWARRRATRAAYPTEAAYEREHEISFRTVAGLAVFKELTGKHLENWTPDPYRPLIISMDLGYQGTSACMWQEEAIHFGDRVYRRQHLFWHELWKGRYLKDVLMEIKMQIIKRGLNWQSARWIADFNSLNTHHGGAGITDYRIFEESGIIPEARKVGQHQVDQGISLIRQSMRLLPDGKPGMLIDKDSAQMVVAMFDGGYRYEEPTPGKSYTETPMKDGTYDHIADSIRYRYWVEPDVVFSPDSEGLPQDAPRRGSTAYVKNYLKFKHDAPDVDGGGMLGPSGGIGPNE